MTSKGEVAERVFEQVILEIRKSFELSKPEEFTAEMCKLFCDLGHIPGCMECKAAA